MKRFLEQIGRDLNAFINIFDTIKDLVFIMEWDDESFRYIYVNQQARRVLNLEKSIIGERLEDVVPVKLAEVLIPKYIEAIKTRKSVYVEEKLDKGTGVFVGETSLNPVLIGGGCRYVLAIVRDNTERHRKETILKKTKEQLENSEQKLSSFVENNRDAVFEFDLQGNFVDVNDMTNRLTGYKENELIGTSFIPLIANDDLDDAIMHFKNALSGSTEDYELAIYHRNGEKVYLLVKNVPIYVKERIVGVYGIAKDVTDKKKMGERLEESDQRYKSLFENHPDAILSFDLNGNIKSGNPAAERMTGYKMDELLNGPIIPLIPMDEVKIWGKYFDLAISEKKAQHFEMTAQVHSGATIDVSLIIIPIMVDSQVTGVNVVAQDITERKQSRLSLINTKRQLEKMAFYDYLSGLPNRRTFDDRLDMAIHLAKRSKKKVAVMMLDGREFKKVNDTFGHDAGDAVIQELASRIQNSVRKMDTVARFGGDEMGIILPEIESVATAVVIAERILHSLKEPLVYKENRIELGAGIGIAIYPDHTVKRRQLVKFADKALYEAKESEQDEYRIYGDDDH